MDPFDRKQPAFNGSPLDDENLLSGQFWDELRVFLAVAKTKSFNRAAGITNTSQSTVSRQVKRLQNMVGSQLFIATARGVKLTEKGEALAQVLGRLDHTLNSITGDLRAETTDAEGTVSVSITDGLNALFAAPALERFSAQYPKIQLHLKNSVNLMHLRENQTDMMIGIGPAESSGIRFRKLGQLHFIPVVAKEYIRKYGLPTRDNLEQHSFLQSQYYGQWDGWQQAVARGRITHYCDNSFAYGVLVKAGQGIGLLGSYTAPGPMHRTAGNRLEDFGSSLPGRAYRSAQRAPCPSRIRLAGRCLRQQQSLVRRRVQVEQSAERLRCRAQEDVQSWREC